MGTGTFHVVIVWEWEQWWQ